VPGYLKARVEAGLELPRVEVVEGEVEGTRWHRRLRRKAETSIAAVEKQAWHAMVQLVVCELSEELFTELMQGFPAPRS
jgi:hypothetical protein